MLHIQSFNFNPLQENTYIVYNDQGDCVLIDPGCYFENERKQLANFLQSKALEPKILLNTHCHLDHVFGLNWVHENYGLPVHIHPLEDRVLEGSTISGVKWGLPFDPYQGTKVYLEEGQQLKIGDHIWDIFWIPGHSPGSICFYDKAQGFLISGDVLFKRSIGRTDLPGGNYESLIQGIHEKILTLPDEVIVYPGHGVPTTVGEERIHNRFLHSSRP